MSALSPQLTTLDKKVLALLPRKRPGVRASTLARLTRVGMDPRHAATVTPQDIRLILRGLEALELAHQREGWWTR